MSITRREFLARSAAAAAVTALGPTAFAFPDRRSFSAYEAAARELLASMTLEEKIGQMVQAEHSRLRDPADVSRLFLGSLLASGDADPPTGNRVTDWAKAADALQSRALATRLKIPLLFGIDAVHGNGNVIGAVIFPHNIGMGCTRNPGLVERAARITAEEVRAIGLNWTFAPCVAVPRDKRWGRTYEGFGESPRLVGRMARAAVDGFQQHELYDPSSVLACAKHFAGDGGTAFGTGAPKKHSNERYPLDEGDTEGNEDVLRRVHMRGYRSAIRSGVATVMASYSSWNGEKISGSRRLLTEILKGEMRFDGFVVSDYNAIDQLSGDYKAQVAEAANAGIDMFMVPTKYRQLHATLLDLAKNGGVAIGRIDEAVLRILRVKLAAGLVTGRPDFADRRLQANVGSAAHRGVARQCVRESLVLLKNSNGLLPMSRTAAHIHVGGDCADDLGKQCGGWTIDWQGSSGRPTVGTTILQAIRNAASPRTQVTFSRDGNGAKGADIGVVVIGESPYAEFYGDRDTLDLDADDVAAVRNMKRAGIPVVVVLVSGRPLVLDPILSISDAILAAWLPGSEGAGAADVLFGDYRPTGRLSMSWPRSTAQSRLNAGDPNYDPLFAYGYGLTWGSRAK